MSRPIQFQNVTTALRRAVIARNSQYTRTVSHTTRRQAPAQSEQPTIPKEDPLASRRGQALPWVLSSLLAGAIGFYIALLAVQVRKPCRNPKIKDISEQKDVSGRYDFTADSFDTDVGVTEILMGVHRLRKRLTKKCKGDVLEVSCGTGRNLGYYDISKDSEVESLTLVDLSPQMVEVCKKKWNVLVGPQKKSDILGGFKTLKQGFVVRFLTGSALDDMPSPPSKKKYDTIIQTMGLCSTPEPKKLMLNIVKHLDTSNSEARILLLEHGRSYRDWLNNTLDNAAEKHAEIHGCWFNRDIGELVTEAANESGLEVVSERRHHVGTTWVFELKPSAQLIEKTLRDEGRSPQQPESPGWLEWIGLK